MSGPIKSTTQAKADMWEGLAPLLRAMHAEFKDLSRKQPGAPLSKKKIAHANRLLARCRELLGDEPCLEFLDLLSEEDVPQNSDATLMLSQYVAAMQQFHDAHHGWLGSEQGWSIQ